MTTPVIHYIFVAHNQNNDNMHLELMNSKLPEIIAHGKAIGFDFENGDFMDLMRSWLESGRKFMVYIEDNKEDVIKSFMRYIK